MQFPSGDVFGSYELSWWSFCVSFTGIRWSFSILKPTHGTKEKLSKTKIRVSWRARLLSQPGLGYIGRSRKASIARPITKTTRHPFYDGLCLASPLTLRDMARAQYHHLSLHFSWAVGRQCDPFLGVPEMLGCGGLAVDSQMLRVIILIQYLFFYCGIKFLLCGTIN